MATLQAWPEDSWVWCRQILEEQRQISAIFRVCLYEGVEEQNYGLITLLTPRIRERAERILYLSRKIATFIPSKGRPPKWGEIILDINALSTQITKVVDKIHQEAKTNRFIVVTRLLEIGQAKSQQIAERFEIIPVPQEIDGIPAIFYQEMRDGE